MQVIGRRANIWLGKDESFSLLVKSREKANNKETKERQSTPIKPSDCLLNLKQVPKYDGPRGGSTLSLPRITSRTLRMPKLAKKMRRSIASWRNSSQLLAQSNNVSTFERGSSKRNTLCGSKKMKRQLYELAEDWQKDEICNNPETAQTFEYLMQEQDTLEVYVRKTHSLHKNMTGYKEDVPVLDNQSRPLTIKLGVTPLPSPLPSTMPKYCDDMSEVHYSGIKNIAERVDDDVYAESSSGEFINIIVKVKRMPKTDFQCPMNEEYLRYDESENLTIGQPYSFSLPYTQEFTHYGVVKWKDTLSLDKYNDEKFRVSEKMPMPLPPGWQRDRRWIEVYINHNNETVQVDHPLK